MRRWIIISKRSNKFGKDHQLSNTQLTIMSMRKIIMRILSIWTKQMRKLIVYKPKRQY